MFEGRHTDTTSPHSLGEQDLLKNIRALGLKGDRFFDQDLFLEIHIRLEKEWREASLEKKRQIVRERYFDCVAPGAERTETIHEESSAMPPPELDGELLQRKGGIRTGFLSDLYGSKKWVEPRYRNSVFQYGPSTIADVNPGGFVCLELGDQNIVGTSDLTSCQAIILQFGSTVFLGHSLFLCEQTIPAVVSEAKKLFGDFNKAFFVYPEIRLPPKASDQEQEFAAIKNNRYLEIAQTNELLAIPYQHIGDFNPLGIGESSVIVSPVGIQVIGTRLAYHSDQVWRGSPTARQWTGKTQRWLRQIIDIKNIV